MWASPDHGKLTQLHSSLWCRVDSTEPLLLQTPINWFLWIPKSQGLRKQVLPNYIRKVLTLQKIAHKVQSLRHRLLQDLLPLFSAVARKRSSTRTRALSNPPLLATALHTTSPFLQPWPALHLGEPDQMLETGEEIPRHHLFRRNCVAGGEWGVEARGPSGKDSTLPSHL